MRQRKTHITPSNNYTTSLCNRDVSRSPHKVEVHLVPMIKFWLDWCKQCKELYNNKTSDVLGKLK